MICLKSDFQAEKLTKKIQAIIRTRRTKHLKLPLIVIIHANDLTTSKTYINCKIDCSVILDLQLIYHKLPKSITYKKIISVIQTYNKNINVTGIIIQLPVYKHLQKYSEKILNQISFEKDVEALSDCHKSYNKFGILPCTAAAVVNTIDEYHLNISKKSDQIIIIGKSVIVGLPLYDYFCRQGYNVLIIDKTSVNIDEKIQNSDLIISATGVPRLLTAAKIKKGAVIIDVGFHITTSGKIIGDVDWKNMAGKAKAISPVPGGIGRMTVLYLFYNSLKIVASADD